MQTKLVGLGLTQGVDPVLALYVLWAKLTKWNSVPPLANSMTPKNNFDQKTKGAQKHYRVKIVRKFHYIILGGKSATNVHKCVCVDVTQVMWGSVHMLCWREPHKLYGPKFKLEGAQYMVKIVRKFQ